MALLNTSFGRTRCHLFVVLAACFTSSLIALPAAAKQVKPAAATAGDAKAISPRGDLNSDGVLNWRDYRILKGLLINAARRSNSNPLSDKIVAAQADVDGNGQIDGQDLNALRLALSKGGAGASQDNDGSEDSRGTGAGAGSVTPVSTPTGIKEPTVVPTVTTPVRQPGVTPPSSRGVTTPTPKPVTPTRTGSGLRPPQFPNQNLVKPVRPSVPGAGGGVALPVTASPVTMGINLGYLTYFSTEWAFVDVMKQSMPWVSSSGGTWDDKRGVEVRPDGGIILKAGQTATTLMLRNSTHFPAGRYVCTYEGTGKVTLAFDARVVSSVPNRIVADVNPTGPGVCLRVEASDPTDPVRNIRFWMPGFEGASSPFHPVFLDRLRGFKTLRFMDWQCTNNSQLVQWKDRTSPHGTQNARFGVAVEHMVDLCNELGTDPWFCIPHLADDEFIRSFAQLVKTRLKPGRKVYIEYSNEVWNWQFRQTQYAADRGKALGLSADPTLAYTRYYSQRACEMFNIWEGEFGGTERLVRVFASQSANPWISRQVVSWNNGAAHADALAVAPYFQADGIASRMPGATVDDVLELAQAYIRNKITDHIYMNKKLANEHGLELITYEGGQHFTAPADAALSDLYMAANRDPRMYDLYADLFNAWGANGGGMFVAYNSVGGFSKWGSWSALEYQDQPLTEAHKFRAIQHAMGGLLPFKAVRPPQLQSLGVYD